MGIYRSVYDFAARAGALEGYVYGKEKMNPESLTNWIHHLVEQYRDLPVEVRKEFQDLCDGTVGRAIRSLQSLIGADHDLILELQQMIDDSLPASPDDFFRTQ